MLEDKLTARLLGVSDHLSPSTHPPQPRYAVTRLHKYRGVPPKRVEKRKQCYDGQLTRRQLGATTFPSTSPFQPRYAVARLRKCRGAPPKRVKKRNNVVLSSSASRDVPVETAYDRFCLRVLRGSSVVCLVAKAKLPTLTEPLLKSRYVAPPLSPVCTLRDLIEPHTAE